MPLWNQVIEVVGSAYQPSSDFLLILQTPSQESFRL
jgi:hypothetical protein